MIYEPDRKLQACAEDAADHLRETRQRRAERAAATEARRDFVLRALALISLAWIVALAYFRL